MNKNQNNNKLILVALLIVLAVATRFFQIAPNFSAVYAIALFAGAFIENKKLAIAIPLVAMLLSDLVLTFHNTMIFVYGALFITTFIGVLIKKHRENYLAIAGSSVLSSFIFYIITNSGHWLITDMYSKDLNGLMASLGMGIPFYRNQFLMNTVYSSLAFSFVLFFGMNMIERSFFEVKEIKNKNN